MKNCIRAFVGAGSAALFCAGCGDPSAGSVAVSQPDRILVIVDLSTSLTNEQRRSIPGLVAGFVFREGRHAVVDVYPLVSDMGHSLPLAPQIQPPKTGRLVDIGEWQNNIDGEWSQTLKANVEEVLVLPTQMQDKLYNSCYIASAVFADRYFGKLSTSGRLWLVWVGDLIEDCRLPAYIQYRALNKQSLRNLSNLSLGLKNLGAVNVKGAILPRKTSSGPSDISSVATTDYWDVLKLRLGMTPELVDIDGAIAVFSPGRRLPEIPHSNK